MKMHKIKSHAVSKKPVIGAKLPKIVCLFVRGVHPAQLRCERYRE